MEFNLIGKDIQAGVPQGSVLGPLEFNYIVVMNGRSLLTKRCNYKMANIADMHSMM